MSNGVFNFNFLALLLSEILGGSQIYITEPCAPRRPPSVKILKRAQVLAYIYYKCKKLQFIHKLTASDTSKTAKITKSDITHQHIA